MRWSYKCRHGLCRSVLRLVFGIDCSFRHEVRWFKEGLSSHFLRLSCGLPGEHLLHVRTTSGRRHAADTFVRREPRLIACRKDAVRFEGSGRDALRDQGRDLGCGRCSFSSCFLPRETTILDSDFQIFDPRPNCKAILNDRIGLEMQFHFNLNLDGV